MSQKQQLSKTQKEHSLKNSTQKRIASSQEKKLTEPQRAEAYYKLRDENMELKKVQKQLDQQIKSIQASLLKIQDDFIKERKEYEENKKQFQLQLNESQEICDSLTSQNQELKEILKKKGQYIAEHQHEKDSKEAQEPQIIEQRSYERLLIEKLTNQLKRTELQLQKLYEENIELRSNQTDAFGNIKKKAFELSQYENEIENLKRELFNKEVIIQQTTLE